MSDCISHGRKGTGYRAKSVLSKHPPKRAKLVAEGRRLPNTGQLTLKTGNRRFGHFVTQSTLVISKLKGSSETIRDIRTSTYQIFRIGENTNGTTKFHKNHVIRLL